MRLHVATTVAPGRGAFQDLLVQSQHCKCIGSYQFHRISEITTTTTRHSTDRDREGDRQIERKRERVSQKEILYQVES